MPAVAARSDSTTALCRRAGFGGGGSGSSELSETRAVAHTAADGARLLHQLPEDRRLPAGVAGVVVLVGARGAQPLEGRHPILDRAALHRRQPLLDRHLRRDLVGDGVGVELDDLQRLPALRRDSGSPAQVAARQASARRPAASRTAAGEGGGGAAQLARRRRRRSSRRELPLRPHRPDQPRGGHGLLLLGRGKDSGRSRFREPCDSATAAGDGTARLPAAAHADAAAAEQYQAAEANQRVEGDRVGRLDVLDEIIRRLLDGRLEARRRGAVGFGDVVERNHRRARR